MQVLILAVLFGVGCGGLSPVDSDDPVSARLGAAADSVAMIRMPDMGPGMEYKGQTGGLYGDGSNIPPPTHDVHGRASADSVQPIGGKVVVLCLGYSNVQRECSRFQAEESGVPLDRRNKKYAIEIGRGIVVVNGAQGNALADDWDQPTEEEYDVVRDQRLPPYTEADVQVVWMELVLKIENRPPTVPLPDSAAQAWRIRDMCDSVIASIRTRYPNVRQVFLSQKIHGFYSDAVPEPYSYETGYGIRACILDHAGEPFVGWGPYLWDPAWGPEYFIDSIGHPSDLALGVIAALLHDFFETSPYAGWWHGLPVPPQCENGLDDDTDGQLDFPADPDCSSATDDSEGAPPPICNNGQDDDSDGKIDFPADPGCSSTADDSENPDPPPPPTIQLTVTVVKSGTKYLAEMTWTDARGDKVDVYMNSNLKATTENDGSFSGSLGRQLPTNAKFKICEAGTSICSAEVPI